MSIPPAPSDPIEQLLARSVEQRCREYKYRFAQTVVFGLPVLALELWSPALDPMGHQRWSPILQALLAGWVLYVNAGMLIEGIILRRLTPDLLITSSALLVYLWSLVSTLHILITGQAWFRPILFAACVLLLGAWTAIQWFRHAR